MHKMKGRLLPRFRGQRSLRDPNMGVRKNPISGDRAQTRVMCLCSTPIPRRVGDTNAVSAAYENSMPMTAADILVSSFLDFFLEENEKSWLSLSQNPFLLKWGIFVHMFLDLHFELHKKPANIGLKFLERYIFV